MVSWNRYIVGTFVTWRQLAFISGVIPGIALLLLPLIPQTPRYLLMAGKSAQGRKSLEWLRNTNSLNQEDIEMELFEVIFCKNLC